MPEDQATEERWPAIARKIRTGTFYICFEEPEAPMVWTGILNSGEAVDVKKRGFASTCKKHPEMGCGVFKIQRVSGRG